MLGLGMVLNQRYLPRPRTEIYKVTGTKKRAYESLSGKIGDTIAFPRRGFSNTLPLVVVEKERHVPSVVLLGKNDGAVKSKAELP